MDTTLNPTQTGMHHGLVADADQELARAYEQITRADEELAHAEQQLSRLEQDAASRRRLVRMNRRGRVVRGFTGLLLAALIGIAAMVSQSSYGNTARPIIARWVPQYVAFSSPAPENRALPAQPGVAIAQAAVDTALTTSLSTTSISATGIFTTGASGSERTGRRRAGRRRPVA